MTRKYIVLISILWAFPVLVGNFGKGFFGGQAWAEQYMRLVPATREIRYMELSKAQTLIDPKSVQVPNGHNRPNIKAIQPMYPMKALSLGLSGWVIVSFTVTAQGTVRDPTVVQDCAWTKGPRLAADCHDKPNSIFDAAAERAALRFKYKPRAINGKPVDTAGVENKIIFRLIK